MRQPYSADMSGVFIVLVTLPWSPVTTSFSSSLGYLDWTGKFARSSIIYVPLASLTMLPGALINAAIAYWIGKMVDGIHKEQSGPAT